MPAKKKLPEMKIETMIVIAKFNDGNCRQLLISKESENAILALLIAADGKVLVLDKIISYLDIERKNTEKHKI